MWAVYITLGTLFWRAALMAVARRALDSVLVPPILTAVLISLRSFMN